MMRPLSRSVGAILVVIIAMPLISLWSTLRIGALSERITTVDEARLSISRTVRYAIAEEDGLRGYLATRSPIFLTGYHDAHPRIVALQRQLPLMFLQAGLYEALPPLSDMTHLHDAWHTDVADPLIANPSRSDALALQKHGKLITDKIRSDADQIQASAAAYVRASTQQMSEVLLTAGLLAVLWILIVGTCAVLIERRTILRETELVMSLVAERDAVERLSEWRSRLLAMLAHDFKSQLAVVIGAAHLLEDFPQRRGDPHLLASVRSAGYTLAEMADNAILMARAQERRLALQNSIFDISEIVSNVVQRYGTQREFHLYPDAPTAMVEGDRAYIMRVMDNIIGNAVKYSELPIDVRITEEVHYIRVTVVDRGIGIEEHDLPHIFEEFWRAERAAYAKTGSGVGLFIVKQIVEAHRGSIRVESKIGMGTTVSVRFPRALTAFTAPILETVKTAT
ncbi:MAG TPA: ATP-binding protein [Candidatus Baltobacteraceae bacterium]|nr:ATP-binding protein [Candidatus Baltobacteraceae bacterium]